MLLRLEAIKFNHDSNSANVDAFNIRKNEKDFIEVPEWRRGVSIEPKDSPAAYALCEMKCNILTIKAKFTFDGPDQLDLSIRAVDANLYQHPVTGNLSPNELQLLAALVPDPAGNVLGEVIATPFTLSPGPTDFQSFNLGSVRIWDVCVGVNNIIWRWQYLLAGTTNWIDFAVTIHRIYTVLEVPNEPWLQTPHDLTNTQLPWVEVLEHACCWVAGAPDTNVAAAMVTEHVHNLGQTVLCYAVVGSTYYTDNYNFDCSSFLELLGGGTGKGNSVNCDDCAAIVTTFANSVGCDLGQMCIRPTVYSTFEVKPHVQIGIKGPQQNILFFHHSVAVEGGCGQDVEVFDACLQIGGTGPSIFSLPTNLPFGMGQSGYHFRLVATKDQPITAPNPNCKRRPLGPAVLGPEACTDPVRMKEHFDFGTWEKPAAFGKTVFVSEFFFADYILAPLQLAGLQKSEAGITPSSIHSLWTPPDSVYGEKLFRIDFYETDSRNDARKRLMGILSTLQAPGLVQQEIEDIGDVTFATPEFHDVLFAIGNLVFYLRNVCRQTHSLVEVGRRVAEVIRNPPPRPIEDPSTPNKVRRFSFPMSDAEVGAGIRLREEPAHPLAPRRLYQFIAEDGEVSLEGGTLIYQPRRAGIHTLKIFATDEQGNVIVQTLPLTVSNPLS